MSDLRFVRVEHVDHVSTLTLDRPEKLNALDADVLADLGKALSALLARPQTRCAVLTGAGRAFVAGADIAAMLEMSSKDAKDLSARGHSVFDTIEALPFPVIAAVNGFALGGGLELALACDFVYASTKAKFGLPEVGLGVVPGFGGTQRLARRIGPGLAREWIFSGRTYDSVEAVRVGLANRSFEPDALVPEAQALAKEIAAKGPKAIASAKSVMRDGMDRPLRDGNSLEIAAFSQLFDTLDRREGMAAFLEKRPANFQGK